MGNSNKLDDEAPSGIYFLPESAAQLPPGRLLRLTVGGRPLLLAIVESRLVAFSARCPHAAADLGDGSLVGRRISCPQHGWKFDVISGRTLWPQDEACRLQRYEIVLQAGRLAVRLSP